MNVNQHTCRPVCIRIWGGCHRPPASAGVSSRRRGPRSPRSTPWLRLWRLKAGTLLPENLNLSFKMCKCMWGNVFLPKKNLFDERSLIPVSWRRNQDLILIRLKEGKGQIKSFSSEFVFADWKTFETLKCSPVESLTEIKLKDLQKCECSSSKLFHF